MRSLVVIVMTCLIGFAFNAQAQTNGSVQFDNAQHADELVKKHIAVNKNMKGIPGFRIQVFSDAGQNSRSRAVRFKAKFKKEYKDIKAYVVFDAPNYKVEIGNFLNRLDAERCLHQIKHEFPGAFIVIEPEMEIPNI